MNPEAASAKFLRDFETQYGNAHPSFIQGSFQNASQRAKREYKFLIVYLHSKHHQDTAKFCRFDFSMNSLSFVRETLGTEIISEFINENFLIWAGDLSNPEPYKLSTMLGAAAYPFLAVITNNSIGGIFCKENRLRGRNDDSGSNRRLSRP